LSGQSASARETSAVTPASCAPKPPASKKARLARVTWELNAAGSATWPGLVHRNLPSGPERHSDEPESAPAGQAGKLRPNHDSHFNKLTHSVALSLLLCACLRALGEVDVALTSHVKGVAASTA
jgi:hypothetical protein